MNELTQEDKTKLIAAKLAMAHFGASKYRLLSNEQKEYIDQILDSEGL